MPAIPCHTPVDFLRFLGTNTKGQKAKINMNKKELSALNSCTTAGAKVIIISLLFVDVEDMFLTLQLLKLRRMQATNWAGHPIQRAETQTRCVLGRGMGARAGGEIYGGVLCFLFPPSVNAQKLMDYTCDRNVFHYYYLRISDEVCHVPTRICDSHGSQKLRL